MPLESIMAMGVEANRFVKEGSLVSLVVWCVAPMNLIKGGFSSIITLLIYKPLSPVLKFGHRAEK